MLVMIAAQQAWAGRARGEAASDAVGERVAEWGGAGEAEIVVRGEVDAGARGEGAATIFGRERGKIGAVDGEGDVAARHARAPYNESRLQETVHPELVEGPFRSEEHTSELQSLMRISYAVFCLKKKTTKHHTRKNIYKTD